MMGITLAIVLISIAGCGSSKSTDGSELVTIESPENVADVAGTYTFNEDAMEGKLQIPWTLVLKEEGTYELTAENPFMGTTTYTGTFIWDGKMVTTSPIDGKEQASWFESDYSCKWYLDGDACTPVNYGNNEKSEEKSDESGINATYSDIAYASVSDSEQCDIYLPEGKGPFPVIVVVHGGGFMFGDQKMELIQPIYEMAMEKQYAVVSIDYRKSSEAQFPAAVADTKAAVRYVKANAEQYGFDENHIAIWGESAGAYLSLMTALTPKVESLNGDVSDNSAVSSAVTALVDFYGPVEFYTMDDEYDALGVEHDAFASDDSFESKFLGQDIGKDQEATYKTYWENYKGQLPEDFTLSAWIEAGDSDTKVPYMQSQNFADRLAEVIGKDHVSYTLISGADHEDDAFYTKENLTDVFGFLDTVMK